MYLIHKQQTQTVQEAMVQLERNLHWISIIIKKKNMN